jgi:hypothetical protein
MKPSPPKICHPSDFRLLSQKFVKVKSNLHLWLLTSARIFMVSLKKKYIYIPDLRTTVTQRQLSDKRECMPALILPLKEGFVGNDCRSCGTTETYA